MRISRYIELLEKSMEDVGEDYDLLITSKDLMKIKEISFGEVAAMMFEEACIDVLTSMMMKEINSNEKN